MTKMEVIAEKEGDTKTEFRIVRPMLAADGKTVLNQIDLDKQAEAVDAGAVLVEELTEVLEARAEAAKVITVEEAVKRRLNLNSPTLARDLAILLVAMFGDQIELDK